MSHISSLQLKITKENRSLGDLTSPSRERPLGAFTSPPRAQKLARRSKGNLATPPAFKMKPRAGRTKRKPAARQPPQSPESRWGWLLHGDKSEC